MAALKALVGLLGIAIIVMATLIGIKLTERSGAPPKPGGPTRAEVPAGATLAETTAAGDRLILRYRLAEGSDRLILLDLAKGGAKIGEVTLEPVAK
ncbi:MAG: hypothetical protein FJX47_01920 [Alphaproteobacteria bacterium]|nr:hypothetical protein [Alphaproteobacteria bacterium]